MVQATFDQTQERDAIYKSVQEKLGFIPNVIKEMSVSPVAAKIYWQGQEWMQEASLSPVEQQIVQFAISRKNGCNYCSSVHLSMLKRMAALPPDTLEAIRSGGVSGNPRYQQLLDMTQLLMEKQGWLTPEELQHFETGGLTRQQTVEIIALIGLKTITNYVNHISHTRLDAELQG